MAYLQARAGIARSGVTYAGWTPPTVKVLINGVDHAGDKVGYEGFTVKPGIDGVPSEASFILNGVVPVLGHDVKITYSPPDNYMFGGTLLQRRALPKTDDADALMWECTAVGYQWLMDRYSLVTKKYYTMGVNAMVADLLATFTNGGFRVGYIPQSLGDLDMEFDDEPVSSCLSRIAKEKGAMWEEDQKVVSMYLTGDYPEAALSTVDDDTELYGVGFDDDLRQIRSRVRVKGQGSATTSAVYGGSTTIPVEDTAPFLPGGGNARARLNVLTYTGVSASSGPGSLTGVSGLVTELAEGDEVRILIDLTDSAAVTALATRLGGGLSGQAMHVIDDGQASAAGAAARAQADVDVFGTPLPELAFTLHDDRHAKVGRIIQVNRTVPFAVADDFLIQGIDIAPLAPVSGTFIHFSKAITLSRFSRSLTTLLKQIED